MQQDRHTRTVTDFCSNFWQQHITPCLQEYITIPNVSPLFDPDWQAQGHMDRAVSLLLDWSRLHLPEHAHIECVTLPGRTPMIVVEVEGSDAAANQHSVLLYGHLDKQPPMQGWRDGLGPWSPVIEDGRLYGRGGADDGYALPASLAAIRALQEAGLPHARCVLLIEASEESGSPDLPAYMEHLADRIGTPELVVCLDSGCGNYDQLWLTTSLRGLVGGSLSVDVLTEGVHSGDAGGVIPDSFRLIRRLLDRLEDPDTGRILPEAFRVDIPAPRLAQARRVADTLGEGVYRRFPTSGSTGPQHADPLECILNRTWRPALSIIGADGLPTTANAGNVHRAGTALKLSLRLPPGCDAERAQASLQELLLSDPPHGADIRFTPDWAADGWESPPIAAWLEQALDAASMSCFERPALLTGEGFSIPFMNMLGERYPEAQFVITGVLGPGSNAHGPNEFLHLDMAQRLTACVGLLLNRHHQQLG